MIQYSNVPTAGLEILPDEIWLIMLTYLSPTDRFYSFGNLNNRLNAILREAGAGIDDRWMSESSRYDELSSCITYVKLQRRCATVDLYLFVHLRSLTILQITQYQISAINPTYLPNLAHLHLTATSNALDADFGRLLQLILNQQFQSLLSIHLPQATFFGTYNCTGHSGLRNVTIGSCRSNRFEVLISLLPNVRFLDIRHLINWPIHEILTHNKLCSLTFHIDADYLDTQEDINRLKRSIPSLQHVKAITLTTKQSQCIPFSSYDTTANF